MQFEHVNKIIFFIGFGRNFPHSLLDSNRRIESTVIVSGPCQRNFVDACFLQFHMFPTVWSYTQQQLGFWNFTSGFV